MTVGNHVDMPRNQVQLVDVPWKIISTSPTVEGCGGCKDFPGSRYKDRREAD